MRTPAEHYAEADRLLSQEVVKRDPTALISQAYIALAAVHAQLAACPNFHDTGSVAQIETKRPVGERL